MMLPLVPVRCSPSDLINPFPPLYVTTAVCSGLLLLQVLLILLIFRGSQRRLSTWVKPLALSISAAPALGAVGLTVWIWLQSRSFIPWCSPARERLSAQTTAYHAAQVGVWITIAVTALLLLVGLATLLLTRWQRRGPGTRASTAG